MHAGLKLVESSADAPQSFSDAAQIKAASQRSLLRFITCGSVDDGKSTLLGRLLFETGAVFEDQLEALQRDSARFGTTGGEPDFALLVDGLSAEREQGITIDVAYRYFSTRNRAFIAADTPGHEQYTRNMATGASTADVAIILVDARKGLLPQTRRHSYIVSMLGVRRVIVAINKIDLVGYDENVFRAIEHDYRALAASLDFVETLVIPVSARYGDNIVSASAAMPWRKGPSLLTMLETIEASPAGDAEFRFPVQWVNRPNLDFRGFSGTIASGSVAVGDRVIALPRNRATKVVGILGPSGALDEAIAGQSVTLTLADEIDVSRGDVIARLGATTAAQRQVTVRLLGVAEAPVAPGRTYLARIGTKVAAARIVALHHAIDVHDYSEVAADKLPMNAIGVAALRFETDVVVAPYRDCQTLGSLLLIDPYTNDTVALGIVEADAAHERAETAVGHRLVVGLARSGLLPAEAAGRKASHHIVWWLAGAILTSAIVLAITARPLLAFGAGLADAVLRPALRLAHDLLWRKAEERRRAQAEKALTLDGGSI